MKVEIKKLNKVCRQIKVDVSGEDLAAKRRSIYQEIGKKLKVPGFRPGTVPLEILEKHHGDFLKEEFTKRVLPVYYQQALEENNLFPVSTPQIQDVRVTNATFSFSATLDVEPQIEIKESVYKGIKIKDEKIQVTDAEIEEAIKKITEEIKKSKEIVTDEEIAKWSSYADYDRLKEAVRAEIFLEKLRQRRAKIENHVTTHLLKQVKVDLSQKQVQQRHKDLMDREIYNLQMHGVAEEEVNRYKKELETKLKTIAESQVKLFYIFNSIAQKENLKGEKKAPEAVLGFILSCAHYEGK